MRTQIRMTINLIRISCIVLMIVTTSLAGCTSELCPGKHSGGNKKSDLTYDSDKGNIPTPYTEKHRRKIQRSAKISWIEVVQNQ